MADDLMTRVDAAIADMVGRGICPQFADLPPDAQASAAQVIESTLPTFGQFAEQYAELERTLHGR